MNPIPNPLKQNNSPIFIVGCGRSGTTLLRLMLNKHSRIAIPEETWYFPYLYKKKEVILKAGEGDWKHKIIDFILANTNVHFPGLKREDLLPELSSINMKDWPSIIPIVNTSFARKEKKPRWGDKTPGYVIHLPLIKELYPNAKIIHIIRDGRDVVPSILKHWNVGPQTNSFIETTLYWKKHVSKGLSDGPIHFGENYMQVRYEDLVANPETELRKICFFIEEEFEPDMLNSNNNATSYIPEWEWHKQLKNPIDKNHVELWRSKMSKHHITLFYLICGNLISKLNYPSVSFFNLKAYTTYIIHYLKTVYKSYFLSVKIQAHKFSSKCTLIIGNNRKAIGRTRA